MNESIKHDAIMCLQKRIAELENQKDAFQKGIIEYENSYSQLLDKYLAAFERITELSQWIRNKREENFACASKEIPDWSIEKDSFYAECTEILEKRS